MDASTPEPVDESVIRALLAEHYGLIVAELLPLPGEYDANWQVTVITGRCVIVKIMHSMRESALLDLQVSLLVRLEERAPSLPVPRIIRSVRGESFTLVPAGVAGPAARLMWVLDFIAGRPYAQVSPRTPALFESIGSALGGMHAALAGFSHPASFRGDFKWDLSRAGWIEAHLDAVTPPARRALVERAMAAFHTHVQPAATAGLLRRGVIHGDANDYNVLASARRGGEPSLAGLLDFGDAHVGWIAGDVAVAAAYAVMDGASPLDALASLVAGFAARFPLLPAEADAILPLVLARLAVSVVNSALRKLIDPGDPYIVISERPAWAALESLTQVPLAFAAVRLRDAAGLPQSAAAAAVRLQADTSQAVSALPSSAVAGISCTFGEGSLYEEDAVDEFEWDRIDAAATVAAAASELPVDTSREWRPCIAHFGSLRPQRPPALDARLDGIVGCEPPAMLLATALSLRAASLVTLPRPALVRACDEYAALLEHAGGFLTIWRGLALAPGVSPGASLPAGSLLGATLPGCALIVQAVVDDAGLGLRFPVWGRSRDAAAWAAFVADASAFAGLPTPPTGASLPPARAETLAARRVLLGGNVRLSYEQPVKAVRGSGQFLFDADGTPYLDVYNNVPSVGHAHPRVARAIASATARLATNTRYLHDSVLAYARELTALLPDPLAVCFFVTSGSEANELALRLARAATGRRDVIVLAHAYHGHTGGLVDISPYKFNGPGGEGAPQHTHVVECPDVFRGPWRRADAGAGAAYAAAGPGALIAAGLRPAAFIAESVPSVAGQIELPPGYLAAVYASVRGAGGVCIADEVQTGFGRLGPDAFWGFQLAGPGVVPDIVTLGKPIGNGFPMGAVVTTRAIAEAFDNGMEFFCTGGGGPVAAAAGRAVLAVLREERLPERAGLVGAHLRAGLEALQARHSIIGDVRGRGLFLGVELVRDRRTLRPATEEAAYVCNRLRALGVLVGTEGPFHSTLKIRPPLCFSTRDADYFIAALDAVLGEEGVRTSVEAEVDNG